ncbi:hypothetical protein A6302_04369 [Methylobrevis pamukkalensis]|uniref:Uncharacterized protein n=1 Tax=Methylobrevis pamukkalensis TaxID=1439726 RepID=A0A1E3GUL3_9HYPH|nr:hypothetical protein A6302_04369 [Methylobrevis pamukkalensis]
MEASSWLKSRNSRSRASVVMPGPVSATLKAIQGVPSGSVFRPADTTTPPRSVNFTALLTRLSSTCRIRASSDRIRAGSVSSTRMRKSRPFSSARDSMMVRTEAMVPARLTGSRSISSLPASSFE